MLVLFSSRSSTSAETEDGVYFIVDSLVIEVREVERGRGAFGEGAVQRGGRDKCACRVVTVKTAPAVFERLLDIGVHPLPHPSAQVSGVESRTVPGEVIPFDHPQQLGPLKVWLTSGFMPPV
jgi:hypothetical protein